MGSEAWQPGVVVPWERLAVQTIGQLSFEIY
jgi:hypothetical protein